MQLCSTKLLELCGDPFLRCDVDNLFMRHKHLFGDHNRLAEFITFIETGKPITREDYTAISENIHLLVRNISGGKACYENLLYISDEKADELAAFRIEKGDIVMAISSNCGATFLYEGDRSENITLSHYLCRFRVDSSRLRPKYLVYYLNSSLMQEYFRGVETGKTQKNLSKVYIHDAPIFVPSICEQDELCKRIAPVESQIKDIESKIVNPTDIIDNVFKHEFSLNYEQFSVLKKVNLHMRNSRYLANNPDLRFSSKFHRDAGDFVAQELNDLTSKKIKHYLAEPIVLGASVSPSDYSDDGEFCYISMATIKNWKFDSESASTVSKEYSDVKQAKTVRKNDIILARSGEGTIGKVALIDDDELQGVFADFTMRIRLKDYNPEFAYYYFRTTYFQYLIEIYKKGLGNNTNIFPIVVREFPMLDISLTEQQRIVDEIHAEIAKQDEIKKQIESLRGQIDVMIQDVLTSSQG